MRVVGVGAGVLFMVALAACVPQDESANTLATLVPPIITEPSTTTPERPTTARPALGTTTTNPVATPTTTQRLPVADWTPGIRYDIGAVQRVTSVGGSLAIEFDRYSYAHPAQGVVDADELDTEPIEYWYSGSPFFNVRPQTRTFVLSPDVEVVVLDDDARSRACSSSGTFPAPTWQTVETSSLGQLAGTRRLASLTYSPQGLVERIRFTQGC